MRVSLTQSAALLISLGLLLLTFGEAPCHAEAGESTAEVRALIEQLGDDSYATRVRARERLQRMGLEAFDELHLAQFHSDNEISMSARYLVSSLSVSWSKETDPPEVRATLSEYGAQGESERSSRIERLAEFRDRKGLPALARLVRFETSLRLSRQAALALMQQPMANDETVGKRNAKLILETLADNQRQASQWLRVYAGDLSRGTYSAGRWRELITTQRQQIDAAANQQATRASVLELVRVCATRAADAGQTDEALRLAEANLDLIAPRTRELVEACTWAIDNNLHPFVLQVRQQHLAMFDSNPILLYGAAEAKKVAGDDEGAEALSQRALLVNPLPLDEQGKTKMQPKDLEETAQAHREIGKQLEQRGLFHWAEREFRHIIEAMEITSVSAVRARADLAQMLSELERNREVVEVLRPLAERVSKDEKLAMQLNASMISVKRIASDVDYHRALALIDDGKTDEAKPLLAKAFDTYPMNIDILIRMYRLEGDRIWRDLVNRELKTTVRRVERDVQDARAQARQRGLIGDLYLAQELNQYAWLISNTEGNYQAALEASLKSLEIEMDGAKLDTCARCYFATGDIENAIRMQKRALKLLPHSPPLQRQLSEFQQALAAKTSLAGGNRPDGADSDEESEPDSNDAAATPVRP